MSFSKNDVVPLFEFDGIPAGATVVSVSGVPGLSPAERAMAEGIAVATDLGHTMGPVEPAGPMGGSIRSTCTVCPRAVIVTTTFPTGSATFYPCEP